MMEDAEGAAYADLLRAAPAAWQCRAEETDAGWFLLAPSLDLLLFNRIIACGMQRPARADDLAGLLRRYREAGLRNYGVQLSPVAQPGTIADWLAEQGLVAADRWTKV